MSERELPGPDFPRFPFVAPPELAGDAPVHPVVIVGAGPVGLTAALTLVRAGVPCVVIEDDARVCTGSRALGMSRRTLEIWDALGAADEILAHGKDWNSGRSFYAGRTILSFKMPDDPVLRHRPMFNIQQCYTEHYLLNVLLGLPGADVRWHSRVTDVRQDADGVRLQVDTPDGGYELRADYVIACDGARSVVRTALGVKLEGESYEANYVIADIELESRSIMERRCWFDPPSNPGLTVLMHGQPDGLWRLDYQLGEDEDAQAALQVDNLKARIQAHLDYVGETGAWRLEWSSLYRVHSRALDEFIHGRVAFAGDAAHLMPIFGIRGLNSGVEDAWNLGCKLAAVINGDAAPALLRGYSHERRSVFAENAALADRNALFMTPPNPGIRLLRDAVLSLSLGDTPVQDIVNPKQATYVPLRDSPLTVVDDVKWTSGPAPGEVVPDLTLAALGVHGPAHLQAAVGHRHRVFCFVGDGTDEAVLDGVKALRDIERLDVTMVCLTAADGAAAAADAALTDARGLLHERFGAAPGAVYLARPDHHIVARWMRPSPADVRSALARSMGGGDIGVPPTSEPDLPLTPAEQIYACLGNALNETPASSQLMLLMKLALRLGLDVDDPAVFKRAVDAARDHLGIDTHGGTGDAHDT